MSCTTRLYLNRFYSICLLVKKHLIIVTKQSLSHPICASLRGVLKNTLVILRLDRSIQIQFYSQPYTHIVYCQYPSTIQTHSLFLLSLDTAVKPQYDEEKFSYDMLNNSICHLFCVISLFSVKLHVALTTYLLNHSHYKAIQW